MLQLTLVELRDLLREKHGEPVVDYSGARAEKEQEWVRLSVLAIANLASYPAPAVFDMKSFDNVQASVFHVSSCPGIYHDYLCYVLLLIDMFIMIYVCV